MLDDIIRSLKWYDLLMLCVAGVFGNVAFLLFYLLMQRAIIIDKENTNDNK